MGPHAGGQASSPEFNLRSLKCTPEEVPGVSEAPSDWLPFVNREAQALNALAVLPKDVLRAHLRDRLKEAYRFPLRLELRCLVVGERHADATPSTTGGGASVSVARQARHLEVVPEGITREAAALTGPLLLQTDRPLQEGSVVRVQFDMADPGAFMPGAPALVGRLLDMKVDVAVEP